MELQQMKTFLEVGRRGSFSAAARALHRTQPAVSAQIRGLERELGQKLFLRGRRGVETTEVGRRLGLRVQEWLRDMEGTLADVRSWGTLDRGRLRFGTTDVPAIHWLPSRLRSFLRKHPGVLVTINVEGSRTLVEQTLRGDVELALVTLPAGHGDLEVRSLLSEPLVVVAPARHPLAGRRSIGLDALALEAMILHKPDSVTRRGIEGVFRSRGLLPRIAMEMANPEAIKRLVRAGLGISVLPESMAREDIRRGLVARLRVKGWDLRRKSGLVWPSWRPLSEVAGAWAEHLQRGAASKGAS